VIETDGRAGPLLTTQELDLLQQLLDEGEPDQVLDAIPRLGVAAERCLSFGQQRLWFLDQLPNKPLYAIPVTLRVRGPLDQVALERAIDEIARRHAVLRSTFPAIDGRPQVVVTPAAKFAVPVIDLDDVPESGRLEHAVQRATEAARRPFDLARGPLFRPCLWRLSRDDHVLQLAMHHIITDWWSVENLVRELIVLYTAFRLGKASPLPELPIDFTDYAAWQRQWLQGDELQRQLGYWTQQLAGAPSALALPTDRSRPPIQTFRGGRHELP